MHVKVAAICLLATIALGGPAGATGHGEEPGPSATISERQALDIAWSAGLVHVEEVTRSADRWEIAGRGIDDDEMVLDIDIRNGRILD